MAIFGGNTLRNTRFRSTAPSGLPEDLHQARVVDLLVRGHERSAEVSGLRDSPQDDLGRGAVANAVVTWFTMNKVFLSYTITSALLLGCGGMSSSETLEDGSNEDDEEGSPGKNYDNPNVGRAPIASAGAAGTPDAEFQFRPMDNVVCDNDFEGSECQGDEDCGSDRVCECGGESPNFCVFATCRSSSDCGGSNRCSLLIAQDSNDCASRAVEYHCETPRDECRRHSDCIGVSACQFDRSLRIRVCIKQEDFCFSNG